MQVEIWSDVVCPWCYLGKRRFEQGLAAFEHRDKVEVVYRSFELDPSAPTDATEPTIDLLASKYGMTPAQAQDAQVQMEQRAAADGLEFRMSDLRSGNTRDAHRLLHLAKERGRQPELAERLHRAYFSEQRSVFDAASLSQLAVEVGLDPAEVADVLAGDGYADEVEADEATAQALGATGVPFFVIDRRYGISGAQPADAITQTLQRAWSDADS
ncbi:MAG TPA: DsbA family oxidoreductase [Mycobacteriales bacterium]|jgi:predicted DsbA family dithiol-disulfide isomerase|nr:DsbA family oxidoreductase [Mycobacteriales bacterium]